MTLPILHLNVGRILNRLGRAAPTGIDRFESAYFRHFIRSPRWRFQPVVVGRHTTRVVPEGIARRIAALLETDGGTAVDDGPARRDLARILDLPFPDDPGHGSPGWRARLGLAALRIVGRAGRRLEPGRDGPALYLQASHSMPPPGALDWLGQSAVRAAFTVHDLIPLRLPAFCRPGADLTQQSQLDLIARHADTIFTVSRAVAADLAAEPRAAGCPQAIVVPPGVEPTFAAGPRIAGPSKPWFVAIGTIEPRKNLDLLLDVWSSIPDDEASPKLVLIGQTGWSTAYAGRITQRAAALPHVRLASGLGDRTIAALLAGSRALLAPSLAEGFGIPLAEAWAMGVPVIAADHPTHREVAAPGTEFLAADSPDAWRAAVLARAPSPDRPGPRTGLPFSWTSHFSALEAGLHDCLKRPKGWRPGLESNQ